MPASPLDNKARQLMWAEMLVEHSAGGKESPIFFGHPNHRGEIPLGCLPPKIWEVIYV